MRIVAYQHIGSTKANIREDEWQFKSNALVLRCYVMGLFLMANPKKYPALDLVQLTGDEPFHREGAAIPNTTVRSFWRWAASNLAGNNLRGHIAEFLVASDFGETEGAPRTEWDSCDLRTRAGLRVEVKSAAYLQSWGQETLSPIIFSIAPARGWNAEIDSRSTKPIRESDVYVFCVLTHQDKQTLDPTNVEQWEFYVLPTKMLNSKVGSQKSLTLGSLLRLHPKKCQYGHIAEAVNDALRT